MCGEVGRRCKIVGEEGNSHRTEAASWSEVSRAVLWPVILKWSQVGSWQEAVRAQAAVAQCQQVHHGVEPG